MKFTVLFATLFCAFLLGSCADNSLITDEEYEKVKGPAPHSADYSNVLPRPTNPYTGKPQ